MYLIDGLLHMLREILIGHLALSGIFNTMLPTKKLDVGN